MTATMAQPRFARMDTTIITHMHVRRTASTGLTGSTAVYSLALDPGSMGFMAEAAIGAAEVGGAEGMVAAAGVVEDMVAAATVTVIAADMATDSEAGTAGAATAHMAARFTNAEADSTAVTADSTATAVDSMVTLEADFTAAEAVVFTAAVEGLMAAEAGLMAAVEAMEADTGN